MRTSAILLALASSCAAEEAPRLNPNVPTDAIQIVDKYTLHASWPGMDREQAIELQMALVTLNRAVQPPPAPEKPATPPADPKPEAPPEKAKPEAPKKEQPK